MAYTGINKSSLNYKNKRFTGNNTSGHAITGVGFAPDTVWFKNASSQQNWRWFDRPRGATKRLSHNSNIPEGTEANQLQAFGSDGFTVGADGSVNGNTETMNAFCFKAGGTGSSNTDGSINTTYTSVNSSAGFSISTFTGTGSNATVGHGLGVAPDMVIVKDRTAGTNNDWFVYHKSISATHYVRINEPDASTTSSTLWQNTAPTSSVFYIGTNGNVNTSGNTYVAYCFASKTGFSKVGSFEGNGSAFPNSPFIYTGFKPKLFIWKNADDGGADDNWNMVDSEAQQYNIRDGGFYWLNSDYTESNFSGNQINFLSNGVKIDKASSYHNQNGSTYIYMAIGQSLVGSNNIPCTAR